MKNLVEEILKQSVTAGVRANVQIMERKAADLLAQLQGTEDVLKEYSRDGVQVSALQEKISGTRSIMEGVLATLNNI